MAHDPSDDWFEDEFANDYLEDDAEDYPDCGLMADGQCTKAGSEECDWDCGALHRHLSGGAVGCCFSP